MNNTAQLPDWLVPDGADLNQNVTQSFDPIEEEPLPIESITAKPEWLVEEDPQVSGETQLKMGGYADSLPSKFDFMGLVEFEVSPELEAMVSGFKHGAKDSTRGVMQASTNLESSKAVQEWIGYDALSLAEEEAQMQALYDSELGGWAQAGQFAGFFADPVGYIVPYLAIAKAGKKVKTLINAVDKATDTRAGKMATVAAQSAAAGGIAGGLSYVGEGQSRATNILFGAGIGAVGGAVAGKYLDHKKAKQQMDIITSYEKDIAVQMAKDKSYKDAVDTIADLYPEQIKQVKEAADFTGHNPTIFKNKDEALAYVDKYINYKKDWQTGKPLFDRAFGLLSSRVSSYNADIGKRLKLIDFKSQMHGHTWKQEMQPFEEVLKKLKTSSPENYSRISKGLLNGDFDEVETVLRDALPKEAAMEALADFAKANKLLNDIGDKAIAAKIFGKKIPNYWHRSIKAGKLDDFMEAVSRKFDKEIKSSTGDTLQKKLDAFRSDFYTKHKRMPTEWEDGNFVTSLIFGRKGRSSPYMYFDYGRKRSTIKVDDELLSFYKDPIESMDTYIHNTASDLAKAEFLGSYKGKSNAKFTEFGALDVETSISNLLNNSQDILRLAPTQRKELTKLIQVRMDAENHSLGTTLSTIRDLTHGALLSNPWSAATQFGDLYATVYKNKLASTVLESIKGKFDDDLAKSGIKIDVNDFGFVDTAIKELESAPKRKKVLDKFMRIGGFTPADHFGKNTFMTTSFKRLEAAAKDGTSADARYFSNKYRSLFGDNYNDIIKEVRNLKKDDTLSEKVKAILYMELSDFQPIGLSETTEVWAKSDNLRAAYFLQSFTLKQIDVLRRESWDLIRQGIKTKNPSLVKDGGKELAKIAMIISSTNMGVQKTKDYLAGKDVGMEPEELPMEFYKTFFRVYGMDPWEFEQDWIKDDVGNIVSAPFVSGTKGLAALPEALIKGFETYDTVLSDEEVYYDLRPILEKFPVIGKALFTEQSPVHDLINLITEGGSLELGDAKLMHNITKRQLPDITEQVNPGYLAREKAMTPTERYNERRMKERNKIKAERVLGYAEGGEVVDKFIPTTKEEVLEWVNKARIAKDTMPIINKETLKEAEQKVYEFAEGGEVVDDTEILLDAQTEEGKQGMTHTTPNTEDASTVDVPLDKRVGEGIIKSVGLDPEGIKWAEKLGEAWGKNHMYGGKGDAARHAALGWLASRSGNPLAYMAIQAKEFGDAFTSSDARIDFHNNSKGAEIEATTKDEAEAIIRSMVEEGPSENTLRYNPKGYAGMYNESPPEPSQPTKLDPGVYQDEDGKLFQVTEKGQIRDMKDIVRDFKK